MINIELDTMRAVKNAALHSTKVCWDDVRNNAAIAAMQSLIANNGTVSNQSALICKIAVRYADELVKELKNINND
jgi:hypothetical protein